MKSPDGTQPACGGCSEPKSCVYSHGHSNRHESRSTIVKWILSTTPDAIPFRLCDVRAVQVAGVSPMATHTRQRNENCACGGYQRNKRRQEPVPIRASTSSFGLRLRARRCRINSFPHEIGPAAVTRSSPDRRSRIRSTAFNTECAIVWIPMFGYQLFEREVSVVIHATTGVSFTGDANE